MNKDYSELIEYLDKKFARIEEDVKGLRGEVSNNRTEIVHIKSEVSDIKEQMATKVEVNKLLDAIDAYLKQGEDYRQEVVSLGNKVDRHEKWIQQLAEKVGLRLGN